MSLRRWILRGAGFDLALFAVSFFIPLGGSHFPVGPAIVLRYVNWPAWWLMHKLITDPGGDGSQLVLYCGAVVLNGAAYGAIAWTVAGVLGPPRPTDP
jgi:hypothetical protein